MRAVRFFARRSSDSLASLGEEGLIRRIRRWLGPAAPSPPRGMGDDCAVLPPVRGRGLLTVDPVVRGVHFGDRTPPAAAGAKLFKRNLSDIAAMGGRPRAAVLALALDGRISKAWLSSFFSGIRRESLRWKVPVVGGDVTQLAGGFVATLTLTGEAAKRVLTRTGSRAGDWIYVTGTLGRSLPTGHHLSFTPRLAEGTWLSRRQQVRAMIDLSDGLAKDLRALAPRGAEPALFPGRVPRRDGASLREALCDGEDYELAFSVDPSGSSSLERAWRAAFPRVRLSCIGRFCRAGAAPGGARRIGGLRGYEHLR
jgi:thiamine-monophosphate kinase